MKQPISLAIDGYEASSERRVGIGRYAFELLSHMHTLLQKEEYAHISATVYVPRAPISSMPRAFDRWKYHQVSPSRAWTFVGLPKQLYRDGDKIDVVFSPTHYIPRFTSLPRVVSIMDVSYVHFPKLFRLRDRYKLTQWSRYSIVHADHVLTISNHSKNAIIEAYNKQNTHITVTYPGFALSQRDYMNKKELIEKYALSKNYILAVGTLQPRKNYVRLIAAFAQFLTQNRQRFQNIELVIVGKKGWLYKEILAAPQTYGVVDSVKFLDYVSDADLQSLYSHALCLMMPSLYEGFGLPVLEAMAYNTPVVVSNVSSLPEIAGKAGVYVDPSDVDSIANGMLTAVRQRNLMQGTARRKHGLEQVKKFSWEKAAKQTLHILERVGRKHIS